MFDIIVSNAAQLCEGSGASVVRFDGELLYLVAQYNVSAEVREAMQRMFPRQPTRELALERAVLDSTVIHVPDAHRDVQHRRDLAVLTGVEAILVAPLLRDGHPIGAIGVTRSHPGPFTDKQIALLKNLRRSSRHCYRERSAVPGIAGPQPGPHGSPGAANGHERSAGSHRRFAN